MIIGERITLMNDCEMVIVRVNQDDTFDALSLDNGRVYRYGKNKPIKSKVPPQSVKPWGDSL